MASRSARPPRGRRQVEEFDDEGGVGAFLMRHRRVLGGLTAFAVAFSYVGANAVWYQPHAHGGAFFATRPLTAPAAASVAQDEAMPGEFETVIRLEREPEGAQQTPPAGPSIETIIAAPAPTPPPAAPTPMISPRGDPVVEDVQRILAELNLYDGDVDGLTGPKTRSAIEGYRKMVGLSASADIDDQLLAQLGAQPRATSSASPLPAGSPGTDMIETSSAVSHDNGLVMRIQAGLKAFGNDGIDIDGQVGSRTKSAILEFQSLFGLPETGEPDQSVYAKMREIGLTD
jgi:peptidoglycan hydrolase-like protein with peptidoglycan-binding domain